MSSATARADVQRLADEQAALRRVAELVARGAGERRLFDAVTHEAASLMGHEATTLVRFVGDPTFTVLSTYQGPAMVGSTVAVPPDDQGPVADILRTGQSAGLDDYRSKEPLFAQAEYGVSSGVAVPIIVDGGIWGLLGVTTTGYRLPDDTERRLQQFA